MKFIEFEFTPFQIEFSFHRLIEEMNKFIHDESRNVIKRAYFEDLLQQMYNNPSLLESIVDEQVLFDNKALIQELLEILFPIALTNNEIKAVSMPFQRLMFNHSKRFQKIIEESGGDYNIDIRDFDQQKYYVATCCIIMNYYFKTSYDLSKSLFIDLPDAEGIIHHYRVLYNADFVEVIPTERAIMLTKEEIELLEDNYDDFELWKKLFPQKSWILRGFGIISLVDTTVESALSMLKENFLQSELLSRQMGDFLAQTFSSIFRVPNIRIGYTPFDQNGVFQEETLKVMEFHSFLINNETTTIELSNAAYKALIVNKSYFSVSDVNNTTMDEEGMKMYTLLKSKGVESGLFAPIVLSNDVEGILEITTDQPRLFHSLNAQKLDVIMPLVTETFQRVKMDHLNHIEAIIQREFTAIHPSVYWKFLEETYRNYLINGVSRDFAINPITFQEVYPLYGAIDIKESGQIRNLAIKRDLIEQIEQLLFIFSEAILSNNQLILEKHILMLTKYLRQLQQNLLSGIEQRIQVYIKNEIHPYLIKENKNFNPVSIRNYRMHVNEQLEIYYKYRKVYDRQVGHINKVFSDVLEARQRVAQVVYPHYYEQFKTDGVEYNIYLGNSISPKKTFDKTYLQNLRLWQLQIMAELMCIHYKSNQSYELPMEVVVLLFVYDSSLGIQFRMDEKRFDIDGVYHTRYALIKKRLDKACIKGTDQRIVQPQKITIAFASLYDIEDYMPYIYYAQQLGLLLDDVEQFEIEEVQSVSGLVGIRVSVNLAYNLLNLDYESLMHNFLQDQCI